MKYSAKQIPVQAIQLDMAIEYARWGGQQRAEAGDWLLCKEGETYTCAAAVFAETYQPIKGMPGHFAKVATVEAEQASSSGHVETLEGLSFYTAGDYLVTNPGGDRYAVERAKFEALYEPAQ